MTDNTEEIIRRLKTLEERVKHLEALEYPSITLTPLDALAEPRDTTLLDATTSRHGLLRKLSGTASQFLNGLGNWAAVAWNDIASKPSTFPPSPHNHAGGDITSQVASAASVPWDGITGKPSIFPPSSHTHTWSQITSKPGYMLMLPSPFNMVDTAGNTWSGGGSRNVGTYVFTAAQNGLSPGIKGVVILMMGTWSSANTSYTLSACPRNGSTNALQVRAQVANVGQITQGIVPTDSNGDFQLVVAGAAMTTPVCRCIGYLI